MQSRRERVVTAAIEVLATGGARALTHRAVDAAASLPTGSTSNLVRTRTALLKAVTDGLEQRDLAVAAPLLDPLPATVEEVARAAARFVSAMATRRHLVLARLALVTEPRVDLSSHHERLLEVATHVLRGAGIDSAEARARTVLDYLDGVLLHLASSPSRLSDETEVEGAVVRLLSGR